MLPKNPHGRTVKAIVRYDLAYICIVSRYGSNFKPLLSNLVHYVE